MNTNILIKVYGSVLMLLAACTNEEPMGDGNTLPEGVYPLEIASVTMSVESSSDPWSADTPQTRVSESDDRTSSHWDKDDIIHVKLGNQETTTYRVTDANGTLELAGKQLYWTRRTDNVTAWYASPQSSDGTISLADQNADNGLAYVLQAKVDNASCENPVTLKFTHSLAKVRVVFSEESTADLTNASVSILAPTTCTVNKGVVTPGSTTDYIPMYEATYSDGEMCYEANVTPNLTLKDNAFRLVVDGKTVICSTTAVTTEAGQLHIITLEVNEKVKEVNVSDITGTEYTVSGNVYMKGNGQSKDLKLTMEAGAKLTIEDVMLAPTTDGDAITCKGDATITLKGNNELSGKYVGADNGYSAILVNSGTLTIKGDDNAKLTATGVGRVAGGAGIGAKNGANIIIESGTIIATGGTEAAGIGSAGFNQPRMGDITIKGGAIEAKGGLYSAGIGGSNSGACGDIIITGGNIKAYGGLQSPGIGCGDAGACRNITITGGTIIATKGNNSPASIGACLATEPEGTVTIDRTKANVTEN